MREAQMNANQNNQSPFHHHDNKQLASANNETINNGAVAIEQERAIAEARGQIQLAKMFPRSMTAAVNELMDACKSIEFAKSAFYAVPKRGSGPSIRFAEEVARCYGNFEYGHRELSRGKGRSEIEVFAWDKEKNNVSKRQITVEHVQDSKQHGAKALRDQADIDNRIANVASKQMRGRILAIVPKVLVEQGILECRKTLAGNNSESINSQISSMIVGFGDFGIKPEQISQYIGHSVDNCTIEDLTDLFGVYNAIQQGARISEYFSFDDKPIDKKSSSLKLQADTQTTSEKTALIARISSCTTQSELQAVQQQIMNYQQGTPDFNDLVVTFNSRIEQLKANKDK